MSKYVVEMVYSLGLTIEVEASSQENAIKKAREKADDIIFVEGSGVDVGCREHGEVTHVREM